MKIERNSKVCVPFKDLKIGDVFIDDDRDVCMKTEYLFADDEILKTNAVTLNFGALFFIKDDYLVWLPKSAKLIVEE